MLFNFWKKSEFEFQSFNVHTPLWALGPLWFLDRSKTCPSCSLRTGTTHSLGMLTVRTKEKTSPKLLEMAHIKISPNPAICPEIIQASAMHRNIWQNKTVHKPDPNSCWCNQQPDFFAEESASTLDERRGRACSSFPSNPTWPHLPKGLPKLQHGSCHGRGGCPCLPLETQDRQASISAMFTTSTEKAPDHVTCLGPKCRHTCTGQRCPLLCLQAFTPCGCARASYSHCSSGLWISLSQTTQSTKNKSGSCRKLNKLYKTHVLNWKYTDNVLSTHAHFWKEVTELTGNKDYSY